MIVTWLHITQLWMAAVTCRHKNSRTIYGIYVINGSWYKMSCHPQNHSILRGCLGQGIQFTEVAIHMQGQTDGSGIDADKNRASVRIRQDHWTNEHKMHRSISEYIENQWKSSKPRQLCWLDICWVHHIYIYIYMYIYMSLKRVRPGPPDCPMGLQLMCCQSTQILLNSHVCNCLHKSHGLHVYIYTHIHIYIYFTYRHGRMDPLCIQTLICYRFPQQTP